jgi:riboflavin kinase/FMN adenylyltransferase
MDNCATSERHENEALTLDRLKFLAVNDPERLPAALDGAIMAIGNFDGLHRGHKAVIEAALAMGRRLDRPVALLSFEPHPRRFFRPDQPMFRLTGEAAKARLAERYGLDAVITLTFDAALAARTAEAFVDEILVARLHIGGAVIGFDFQFGARRGGNAAFLAEAGKRHGFPVEIIPELRDAAEEISSTLIRGKLEQGDVAGANMLLGYEWFVLGEVIHGRKLGRSINYPTANIRLDEDCGLRHGIYAVRIQFEGVSRDGVASFGRRPTFDNGAPLLEVFVFDFDGDLYGRLVEVTFVGYIRDEAKFDSVEALVRQMDADSARAREMLRAAA